jgi:hypothetical protein
MASEIVRAAYLGSDAVEDLLEPSREPADYVAGVERVV